MKDLKLTNDILDRPVIYTLIEHFLSTKTTGTAEEYKKVLHKFLDNYGTFTPMTLSEWFNELTTTGKYSEGTKQMYFYSVKSFFSYLVKMGQIPTNPLDLYKIKSSKRTNSYPPLTKNTVKTLFKHKLKPNHPLAMVRMQLLTGMRSEEIICLKLHDWDPGRAILEVKGKGGKYRRLKLNPEAVRLRRYIIEHDSLLAGDWDYQAIERGKRNYRNRLASYIKRRRIRKFTSHCLRATFASQLYANGASLEKISKILGHEKYETTRKYIEALRPHTESPLPGSEELYKIPNYRHIA